MLRQKRTLFSNMSPTFVRSTTKVSGIFRHKRGKYMKLDILFVNLCCFLQYHNLLQRVSTRILQKSLAKFQSWNQSSWSRTGIEASCCQVQLHAPSTSLSFYANLLFDLLFCINCFLLFDYFFLYEMLLNHWKELIIIMIMLFYIQVCGNGIRLLVKYQGTQQNPVELRITPHNSV